MNKANLSDSVNNTVVSVCALVCTGQTLKPTVLDDLECQTKLSSHLLEFSQYTIGDVRNG